MSSSFIWKKLPTSTLAGNARTARYLQEPTANSQAGRQREVERQKQESRASTCGCWNFAEEKVNAAAGTLFLAGELRRTELRGDGLLAGSDLKIVW
jgi:hypothetical protein